MSRLLLRLGFRWRNRRGALDHGARCGIDSGSARYWAESDLGGFGVVARERRKQKWWILYLAKEELEMNFGLHL